MARSCALCAATPRSYTAHRAGRGQSDRASKDAAHFYCWVKTPNTTNRLYNVCPVWEGYADRRTWRVPLRRYPVDPRWVDNLNTNYKLDSPGDDGQGLYLELIALCRKGFVARKRQVDASSEYLSRRKVKKLVDEVVADVRSGMKDFVVPPPMIEWLTDCFWREGHARARNEFLRSPVFVLGGESGLGKSELCVAAPKVVLGRPPALELEIGEGMEVPDGFRELDRDVHGGASFDDCHELSFIRANQQMLQGSYRRVLEFALTAGGTCKYSKYLWNMPIMFTVNPSTCVGVAGGAPATPPRARGWPPRAPPPPDAKPRRDGGWLWWCSCAG